MKALIISDTHGFHKQLIIPSDIDVIIHAGDGGNIKSPVFNEDEMQNFLHWYNELPVKHKIYVAGNHDTSIEKKLIDPRDFKNIIYLEHEEYILESPKMSGRPLKIFGSPYTPEFCQWAFNVSRHKIDKYWKEIPEDTDILVTHGPPKGILDIADRQSDDQMEYCGCKSLLNRVLEVKPLLHCYGHIHDNGNNINKGVVYRNGIYFANCSSVTDRQFNKGLTSHGILFEVENGGIRILQ